MFNIKSGSMSDIEGLFNLKANIADKLGFDNTKEKSRDRYGNPK